MSIVQTLPVTATLLKIQRAESGRLLALADVEIEIAGIALRLHGVRVIATGPRQRGVAAPGYRMATGRLADAVTLPPELARAVADIVLDEYESLRRRTSPSSAMSGRGLKTLGRLNP